ncbi:TRAP transporter large permease [Comamonadaceae bacterium G21597-S1]|nr:TRAP transporter large permease [Comamonadaceae bacterium G21597-S1]
MDPLLLGGLAFAIAMALIALRLPIGYALGGISVVATFIMYASPATGGFDMERAIRPTLSLIANNSFSFIHSYELSLVPLYILLGALAYRTGITTDIYQAMRVWLAKAPGGLAMASILGCGGFSAITGSSVACAATMGRIAVPEMLRYGYSPRLSTASVAAGGTLGSLIPPSVPFAIYGIFTEQSISKLFLAGVGPGVLSMVGYLLVVWLWVRKRPQDAPSSGLHFARRDYLLAMVRAWPAVLLFLIIVVGIYGGIFTATEAAAVSVAVVLALGIVAKRLTWRAFFESLTEATIQTAAIFFVAVGAKTFATFIALTGAANEVVLWIGSLGLAEWTVLLAITGLYLVLGMFLDSLGILLLTLPVMVPLVEGMGINLIWFGVIVIKMLEIGLITPPVGFNCFVIHSVVAGKAELQDIFIGIWRFLMMDIVVMGLILAFPLISLWLPTMAG